MPREICEMGDDGIVRCRIVYDDEEQPEPQPEPAPDPDEPESLPEPPKDDRETGRLLQALLREAARSRQSAIRITTTMTAWVRTRHQD